MADERYRKMIIRQSLGEGGQTKLSVFSTGID
jgi:hypothetical protein